MKFWIGDPCYVLTDSQMKQVLDRWDPEVDVDETFTCVVYDTWNGDGRFYDQNNNEYLVDSGMLCVIPECCIREDRVDSHYPLSGTVHEDVDMWIHSSDNGTLQFGDVIIITGPTDKE